MTGEAMVWRERDGVDWLAWEAGGVHAAFPARSGGASRPPYGSLNLGLSVGDDPEAVLENRRRLCAAIGVPLERLVVPGQVHGTALEWVAEADAGRGACDSPSVIRERDGLLTATTGLGLAVSYADCVPVVIVADGDEGPAFATVHAGWRGMLAGVVGAAAAELAAGRRLRAAALRGSVPRLIRRRDGRPLALRAARPGGRRGADRAHLRGRSLYRVRPALLLPPARPRDHGPAPGRRLAAGSVGRPQK